MNPNTEIKGLGRQTLASGASIIITPTPTNSRQRQFVISNTGAIIDADILYLCDTAGNEAIAVFPQTAITLETDAPFRLTNPLDLAQAEIPYCVGQLIGAHAGSLQA